MQVTCHTNAKVSFLALDSLRQLAMRFLEKEELAHFKFQKDFLKPFEHAMVHNTNPDARDMVLQCLHQMIQSRGRNLRSGWRTMFGVFAAAAKVPTERIAVQAFDIVQRVNKDNFAQIVEFGSFADLTVCVTDFCKVTKFQRVSLQAIELLKSLVPMMLACPECPLSAAANGGKPVEATATDDPMIRFWFPLLFGFYDVVMNGEDLEVRKRCVLLPLSRSRVVVVEPKPDSDPSLAARSTTCSTRSSGTARASPPSSGTRSARRSCSRSLPSCGRGRTCRASRRRRT